MRESKIMNIPSCNGLSVILRITYNLSSDHASLTQIEMNKVIYFFQNIFYDEVFLKMRANRANRDTVIMIDLSIFSDANTSTTSFSQEPSEQSPLYSTIFIKVLLL